MAAPEYQLVVGSMSGAIGSKVFVAVGEITLAVPTRVQSELDAIGDIEFTFPVNEAPFQSMSALLNRVAGFSFPVPAVGFHTGRYLLPPSVFPGVREVQVWRDGVIVDGGPVISARADRRQVTVKAANPLWYLSRRNFGPVITEYLLNPEFEDGLNHWTSNNVTASVGTSSPAPALGSQYARLHHTVYDDDSYISQSFTYTAPGGEGTFFDLAGWFRIDTGPGPFVGGALADRGLFIQGTEAGVVQQFQYAQITNSTPTDVWTREEVPTPAHAEIIVPAGHTWTIEARCYCGEGDVLWDALQLTVQESTGSVLGGSDVTTIMSNVLAYAQDATKGGSDLGILFASLHWSGTAFVSGNTGIILERHYQSSDNAGILDALNEFPTIGVCDFAVVWATDGRTRTFTVYSPAKGQTKLNQVIEVDAEAMVDLTFEVSGGSTSTAVRTLGQGSSGSSREIGYAADPSGLGGRRVIDAVLTSGSTTLTSATAAFTALDVGQGVYATGLARGTVVASVTNATTVVLNNPATVSATGAALGIGGLILDEILSPRPDTTIDALAGLAATELRRTQAAQILPSPRLAAGGPNGLQGHVEVGDVVPVLIDYGWAQALVNQRITKLTLLPITEELEPTLNPINA